MIEMSFRREQKAASEKEEAYDDAKDHERCADCKGSGYYVGLMERSYCRACDGAGWV
jgi:DnaJ-class molecular chaperone